MTTERLSLEQVREWARACQSDDPAEVSNALAEAYHHARPFIIYVSLKAAKPGLDKEDMIAAGTEGFVTALTRFDWKSENAKLGFVGSYIRNFVLKECSFHAGTMSASYSSYSRDNRIRALRNALELDGIEPTPERISKASTDPKFSRAGYGRKRRDGTDRQPVEITVPQINDFLKREVRVFSDIDGVDAASPTDEGQYSELVELAREIANNNCQHPDLVMETFEKGRIPTKELESEGVTRAELTADTKTLVSILREQLSADDLTR